MAARSVEALLSGLLRGVRTPDDVLVCEKHPERAAYLSETYGVKTVEVAEALSVARTVLLAVKPQDIEKLFAEMREHITLDHVIVSVAAGITTAQIEAALPAGVPVVRCMPNTPALVDEAMTAISAGAHAREEHLAFAESLLMTVGKVVRVPESQLDAVSPKLRGLR